MQMITIRDYDPNTSPCHGDLVLDMTGINVLRETYIQKTSLLSTDENIRFLSITIGSSLEKIQIDLMRLGTEEYEIVHVERTTTRTED